MGRIEILIIALAMAVTCFGDKWGVLPPSCNFEDGPDDEIYLICIPRTWNGNVIVYNRDYLLPMSPYPTELPYLPLESFINPVDGEYLWNTVMELDYALIATSYEGYPFETYDCYVDTLDLIEWFVEEHPETENIITLGDGVGGLVAARFCVEQPVSGCITNGAPLGSWQGTINRAGDSRAVFDFFYPGLLPGSPVDVPDELFYDWFSEESEYKAKVDSALSDLETAEEIYSILDMYNHEAFMLTFSYYVALGVELTAQVGCSPYSNVYTHYSGSDDDRCLNKDIKRYDTNCPEGSTYDAPVNFSRPIFAVLSIRDPMIPNSDVGVLFEKLADVVNPEAEYPLALVSTFTEGSAVVSSELIQTTIREIEQAAVLY